MTVGMLLTPEFTDQERTQIATDRDTGESLYTVTVFVMEDDRADTIKVTVPKSGLPNGRNVGTFEEQSLAQPPGAKNRSSGGSLTLWSAGELFRVSLLDQGRPADAGRRAPAVGDRRPLLSAAPLAMATDHSARRARERSRTTNRKPRSDPLSSRLAGHLRGRPAGSRRPGRPCLLPGWGP
ncbi:hypothetical protein [Streptomyces sp. NBC_01455]|uniref:hypothetical protein n=1 Tax=Streptomyces sp. NBC_01455 TaxID=2903874 RepID=UPI002E354CDD|nr:hypothetical protein [Streptomyces sp. NBC_01455]